MFIRFLIYSNLQQLNSVLSVSEELTLYIQCNDIYMTVNMYPIQRHKFDVTTDITVHLVLKYFLPLLYQSSETNISVNNSIPV